MMKKEQFLYEVKQFICSKEAKRFVTAELEFHLKQSTEALKKQGYTEEEAEVKSVQQMGSPITIGQKLNRLHRPKVDWRLTALFLLVMSLGFIPLLVLSSESYYYSFYAKLVGCLLGLGVAGAVMFMDYTKLSKFGWVFYGLGCSVVLFTSEFGPTVNGMPSLNLGFFYSDILITLPLFLLGWAGILRNERINMFLVGLLFFFPMLLLYRAVNWPSIVIYFVMVSTMILKTRLDKKKMILFASAMIGIAAATFYRFPLKEYQLARIYSFIAPEKYGGGMEYLYVRVKELIGNAGLFGGTQQVEIYFPEGSPDLILTSLTYELGWIFALLLSGILLLCIFRMFFILTNIKDDYGTLLISGGLAMFAMQVFINLGMSFGVLPIVSVSLPFISYGVSGTLLNSFIFGIVLSVYRKKDVIWTVQS
ncbi:hypothetical protein AKG34_17075 [Peribacillus butanolivorans]|nr:hypothetical protein AKG34_17075 [Peribacillus butanolivorans]